MKLSYTVFIATLLVSTGCGRREQPEAPTAPEESTTVPPKQDTRQIIVAFGDSLSSGHGAGQGHSYPDYLQAELDRRGYSYRVENAGVSGDTTSAGLARIDGVVALKPVIVILEFGGNDGLRGIPVSSSQANLDQMISTLREAGALVVLAGMTLPPNYGPDYIHSFERIYTALAAKHKIPLIPFLLEGIATDRRYMQDDGIHPTREGNRLVAQTVFRTLAPLLSTVRR